MYTKHMHTILYPTLDIYQLPQFYPEFIQYTQLLFQINLGDSVMNSGA